MAAEDEWVLCSICFALVPSTAVHFKETKHKSFHIPIDGELNLVCSSCGSNFAYLSEVAMHIESYPEHKEFQETTMDDDVEVMLSVPKNCIRALERTGLVKLGSTSPDPSSGPSTSNVNVESITMHMESLKMDHISYATKATDAESESSEDEVTDAKKGLLARRSLVYLGFSEGQIKNLKEKYVLIEDVDRDVAIKLIDDVLISSEAKKGVISFSLTNVSSKEASFVYDRSLKQLCLKRVMHKCCTDNLNSKMKAIRLSRMLKEIRRLLVENRTIRCHEIPYTYPDMYAKQSLSDNDVTEICAMLGVTRESLNIYTSPTGSIKGNLFLYMSDDYLLLNCNLGGLSGCKIPTETHKVTRARSRKMIKYILLVEKETVFEALADRGFHNKHYCILITGSGQPSVSTRVLLRRLSDLLDVPIYGFFDGNPSGAEMYCTYRFGSKNRALDVCLPVPDLIWLGLFPQEIEGYTTKMEEVHVDKLTSLMENEYIRDVPDLSDKLSVMLMRREMADLDIITRHFDLEKFVVDKIKEAMGLHVQ